LRRKKKVEKDNLGITEDTNDYNKHNFGVVLYGRNRRVYFTEASIYYDSFGWGRLSNDFEINIKNY